MAYLILTANGEEFERRELCGSEPIIIGRAPDCDVVVRDIILSRRHCRIEPTEDAGWRIVDLHSKNGTHLRGQPIESRVLQDSDELRIGRSRLTFRAGAFVPASRSAAKQRPAAVARPVDPHEALAGTVTGMVVCEPGETQQHAGMPMPQPRPIDPNAFAADGVYDMINEIASSSWDSIQAQASQPTRMQRAMPVPGVTSANRAAGPGPIGVARPKPRVSFALQADADVVADAELTRRETAPPPLQSQPLQPPSRFRHPLRPLRSLRAQDRRFWLATTSVAATALFIAGWVSLAVRAAQRDGPTSPPPAGTSQPQPARFDAPPVAIEPSSRIDAQPVHLSRHP